MDFNGNQNNSEQSDLSGIQTQISVLDLKTQHQSSSTDPDKTTFFRVDATQLHVLDIVNETSNINVLAGTNINLMPGDNSKVLLASDLQITGQIVHEVSKNNTFASNTFNFNCDTSMTQTVLGEGMTGNGNITFSNEQEGTTYIIIFTQGSGTYNVSLPSGYWLNDEVYNFSTLIAGAKAIITAVYIDGSWIFSAKGLLSV